MKSAGPGQTLVRAKLANRCGAWFEQIDSDGTFTWVAAQGGAVVATGTTGGPVTYDPAV